MNVLLGVFDPENAGPGRCCASLAEAPATAQGGHPGDGEGDERNLTCSALPGVGWPHWPAGVGEFFRFFQRPRAF